MSLLEERLRRQGPRRDPGQEVEAGGNAPFSLDAAGMGGPACLLLEGTVELFAAPRREDGTWGPRTHLATATAGQMLFGAPASETGLCFLAVGRHGARLLRLSADDLARLAADPDLAVELAAHLDGWATRLLGGLQLPPAPKVFQEVRPGAEVELPEEGGAVRPREGVVWVRATVDVPGGGPSPLGGGGLEQGGGQEGGGLSQGNSPSSSLTTEPAPLLTSPLSQPPPAQGGGTHPPAMPANKANQYASSSRAAATTLSLSGISTFSRLLA